MNSVVSGLFFLGAADLLSDDALLLAWTGFLGAELGTWLTAAIAGGEMPVNDGLLVASGAGWGAAYSALMVAILGTTGTKMRSERVFDVMAISTGVGAGAMALATMKYNPTTAQILRANIFGAGVGGAVLGLSLLVLGTDTATPYALALVSSAGAITAVSLLWEEAAERPKRRGSALRFSTEARRRTGRTPTCGGDAVRGRPGKGGLVRAGNPPSVHGTRATFPGSAVRLARDSWPAIASRRGARDVRRGAASARLERSPARREAV